MPPSSIMARLTALSVRSGVCCRKGSAPVAAVERHGRGHLRFGPVGCVLPEGFSPSCRRRGSWPGSPPFRAGGGWGGGGGGHQVSPAERRARATSDSGGWGVGERGGGAAVGGGGVRVA